MSSYVTAEIPREKLKQLIEKNGDALLNDPDRTEALLRDHCGSHRREISALVGALEERVPLELKSSWQSAMTPEAMRARLVQRLEENRGLSTEVATWAVDAWSYALGVGLARRSDPVADLPIPAAAGIALGGVETPGETQAKSVAERIASDRAGGVVVPPDHGKSSSLAALNTPKKAGIGAVVALGLAAAGFAMFHQPTPPKPGPNNGNQPGVQNNGGGQQGGGSQGSGSQGNNGNGGSGATGGTNSQGNGSSGSAGGDNSASNHNGDSKPIPAHGNGGGQSGLEGNGGSSVPAALKIPIGTPIPVRLDRPLNSDDLNQGDLVDATVSSPVTVNGDVVIRTEARAHLRVVSIDRTPAANGTEHLRLALVDVVTAKGRVPVVSRTHDFAGPRASQDAVKRAGVGGAVGAVGGLIVGHLFHHAGAGAAAGAGTGAVAGAVTAKPGPVKMGAETSMQFQLTRAVQ